MKKHSWMLLLCLCWCASAQAASFDCARVGTAVEKLVCANPTLSRLDDMLAAAYREATEASDRAADLLQQQRRWLRQRAVCQTVACLESVYERRIIELECLQDLNTGSCADSHVVRTKLPRTADGRLMLLTRRECRIGFDGGVETKNHAEATQIQADCIEADVYDPCEDAGGRWGQAQCAWAHLEVAKRRINKAEAKIRLLFQGQSDERVISRALERSGKYWLAQSESTCAKRNQRWPAVKEKSPETDTSELTEPPIDESEESESLGYCERRLTTMRAVELELWEEKLKASHGSTGNVQDFLEFLSGSTVR